MKGTLNEAEEPKIGNLWPVGQEQSISCDDEFDPGSQMMFVNPETFLVLPVPDITLYIRRRFCPSQVHHTLSLLFIFPGQQRHSTGNDKQEGGQSLHKW